jgi:hypothetical protein
VPDHEAEGVTPDSSVWLNLLSFNISKFELESESTALPVEA